MGRVFERNTCGRKEVGPFRSVVSAAAVRCNINDDGRPSPLLSIPSSPRSHGGCNFCDNPPRGALFVNINNPVNINIDEPVNGDRYHRCSSAIFFCFFQPSSSGRREFEVEENLRIAFQCIGLRILVNRSIRRDTNVIKFVGRGDI